MAVLAGRVWFSVDSRIPNRLLSEALREKTLHGFRSFSTIIPETALGRSRIDFLLESNGQKCLLEVKSCTLVQNGVAMFPDASTARGRRHLLELIRAKRRGFRACLMFVIQRSDANVSTLNGETDPEFANALRQAKNTGVEIFARKRNVRSFQIGLSELVHAEI